MLTSASCSRIGLLAAAIVLISSLAVLAVNSAEKQGQFRDSTLDFAKNVDGTLAEIRPAAVAEGTPIRPH